jgi:hypothetical protein
MLIGVDMRRRWPPIETDMRRHHCQGSRAVNFVSLVMQFLTADVIGRPETALRLDPIRD